MVQKETIFGLCEWRWRKYGICRTGPIVSGRRPGQSFVAVCRSIWSESWPWPWQRKSSNCWLRSHWLFLFRLRAGESISSYFFRPKIYIKIALHLTSTLLNEAHESERHVDGAGRSSGSQLLCFCKPTLLMCVCLSGWLGVVEWVAVGGGQSWECAGECVIHVRVLCKRFEVHGGLRKLN